MKSFITISAVVILLCVQLAGHAESPPPDTDWLSPEAGASESKMGARIDSITEVEKNLQRIEISLPELPSNIEEVVVVGKRPDAPQRIKQIKRFEYLADPESGRSGIIIYIGKRQPFALKINYDDSNARFPYD